jgi:hypothetical protein
MVREIVRQQFFCAETNDYLEPQNLQLGLQGATDRSVVIDHYHCGLSNA